jgi:hypothetical protein
MSQKRFPIIPVLCAAYAAFLLAFLLVRIDACLWDFKTYYYAAMTAFSNQNPYDLFTLSKAAPSPVLYNYVYPRFTLHFFRPFTLFDYHTAAVCFLLLKCALLAMLVTAWSRFFLQRTAGALFFVLLIFGFNSAVFMDLKVGNISIIEQALLWSAFYFFVKKRYFLFCGCLVAGSVCKVFPLAFVALLLFGSGPRKYWFCAGTIAVFGCIMGAEYIANPAFFRGFLANASQLYYESGMHNPSTMALIRDLAGFVTVKTGMHVPPAAQWAVFCILSGAVIWTTVAAIRSLRGRDDFQARIRVLFMVCFTYAILHPRFKDYSYILLLAPAYDVARRLSGAVAPALAILIMLIPGKSNLPGWNLLIEYYPLIVAFGLWHVCRKQLGQSPDVALQAI